MYSVVLSCEIIVQGQLAIEFPNARKSNMQRCEVFIAFISLLMLILGIHQSVNAQQRLPFGAKARFGINKGEIRDTAFTADGSHIAIASSMGVWLYDAAKGTETALAPATPFDVSAIAFSPDGKVLASGSGEGVIWLQHIETGAVRHFSPEHKQGILSVAFSPDGKTLVSGSRDQTIGLWDTETGKLRNRFSGHTSTVNIVAFSPDGKTLASGSSDETVRLWNPETGELRRTFLEHKNDNNSITEVAFSRDGKMIASGGTEWPMLYVWDIETGKVRYKHHSHNWSVDALAFSPDGTKLAIGGDTDAIEWLDVDFSHVNGIPITPTDMFPTDHPGWVSALVFSPDGKTLATVSRNGTILLWDWDKIRPNR